MEVFAIAYITDSVWGVGGYLLGEVAHLFNKGGVLEQGLSLGGNGKSVKVLPSRPILFESLLFAEGTV